jgi:DNA modification methylase
MQPYYKSEYGTLFHGDCLAVLRELPDQSINCCVTSPPYWGLRDYGVEGQIGLEQTPEEYVQRMVEVFREVRRVLRGDGTLWLNLGDSYAGSGKGRMADGSHSEGGKQATNTGAVIGQLHKADADGLKPKDLIGIPWRVAFALQADGWYLRQDIIWSKPNPMPESVRDRCTKAHEYIFLLSKQGRYCYDADAIAEPLTESSVARLSQDIEHQQGSMRVPGKTNGTTKAVSRRDTFDRNGPVSEHVIPGQGYAQHRQRGSGNLERKYGEDRDRPGSHLGASIPWEGQTRNKRDVWTVATRPFSEAHFATFPLELIEPCILAGCPKGGTVLDPFFGSGTTGLCCQMNGRLWAGIELNEKYCGLSIKRVNGEIGQIEGQESIFNTAQ